MTEIQKNETDETFSLLTKYNDMYKIKISKLENYEILEKIVFNDKELDVIGKLIKSCMMSREYDAVNTYYKELVTVFLVSCAKYYYNNGKGGFWDAVENYAGVSTDFQRNKLIATFNQVLKENNLNTFEEYKHEGYSKLAPIIAHAGLPDNLANNLISNLAILREQDISYNSIGEEALFVCRYATTNVKRYLKVLRQNGLLNDFVFEILSLMKEKPTAIDANFDLSPSIQESIIKYCNNKTSNKNISQYGYFKYPTLKYDITSCSLIFETPEMTSTTSSYYIWEVVGDDKKIQKKVYAEEINGQNYFRKSSFVLDYASQIKVRLINDCGETEKEFTLKEKGDVLTFNSNGKINKTRFILNNGAFILIESTYEPKQELEYVRKFNNGNLYYQPPTEAESIVFESITGEIVTIKVKKPFELVKNNTLIGQQCEFYDYDAFWSLPNIQVPVNGDWRITIENANEKQELNVSIQDFLLKLNELVSIGFGKISLRLYNKDIGYKAFKFLYLPKINIDFDKYYPTINGYTACQIGFQKVENVSILNERKEEVSAKVEILEYDDKFIGFYKYLDNEYKFKIVVKPYKWTFENQEKLLGKPNTTLSLSVKDLTSNGGCLLNISNNTVEVVRLKFDNNIDTRSIKIGPNLQSTINMTEYIEFISATDGNCLIYLEQDFKKICDLCVVRINISVQNLTYNELGNNIIFQWDEDGVCKNREMVFRYLTRPYEFFTIAISNGVKMAYVDKNDLRLEEDCIVEIVAKKEKSVFSVEEKIDIIDENNFILLKIRHSNNFNFDFKDNDETDFKNALYTYLTYKFNKSIFTDKNQENDALSLVREYLIKNRFFFGDEVLIKYLFTYNLSQEQLNSIMEDLNLYFPLLSDEKNLTDAMYNQILDLDRSLYLIYACLKQDKKQIDIILENGLKFLNNFQDVEAFMWAKSYYVFPDYKNLPYFQNRIQILKKENKSKKEEELLLDILVNLLVNNKIKFNEEELNLLKASSKYVKNMINKYPKTFNYKIFSAAAQKGRK